MAAAQLQVAWHFNQPLVLLPMAENRGYELHIYRELQQKPFQGCLALHGADSSKIGTYMKLELPERT